MELFAHADHAQGNRFVFFSPTTLECIFGQKSSLDSSGDSFEDFFADISSENLLAGKPAGVECFDGTPRALDVDVFNVDEPRRVFFNLGVAYTAVLATLLFDILP